MSDATDQSGLEAARGRLEAALSALAQGVASTHDALGMAATTELEKASLTERITALEQENLKLHEQVAAYALQPGPEAANGKFEALEEEKQAIERNYQMLKEKYAALQDQLDADTAASLPESANDNAVAVENSRLKQIISEMEEEKNAIRGELDKTILELETIMEGS